MAKDGTNRGGRRIGAGRPRKSLDEPNPRDSQDFEIPAPKDYISAQQRDGGKTCAEQIYRETFDWLVNCNCAELVSPQLVETFAQLMARHIQAEREVSRTAFLARHPTTGEPTPSPLVRISLDYLKAAQQTWYTIQQIVNSQGVDEIPDFSDLAVKLDD